MVSRCFCDYFLISTWRDQEEIQAEVLGKSACKVAREVAGWGGLGLVLGKGGGRGGWGKCLEILMERGAWEKCLRGCMRGCRMGCAGIGAWKLRRVDAKKKCSGCSNQEVLGNNISNNTTAHHSVGAIVVSMGQLKQSVVNTTAQI